MKKILIFTLVLVLSLTSIYASWSFGVDLGYGYNRIRKQNAIYETTGFNGSIDVGYDFDEQWGLRGTFTLSSFGKVTLSGTHYDDKAGLAYGFALDAVNPYYVNNKVTFIDYYGLEMIYGNAMRTNDSQDRTYLSFGVNTGAEIKVSATDHFGVKFGLNLSYMFLTASKFFNSGNSKLTTVIYPRAYIGAEYSL